MSIDPYSSPASHVQAPSYSSQGAVSQGVLAQLAGTKPWVRLMAVLTFIGAGLMLLGALGMGAAGILGGIGDQGGKGVGVLAGMAIGYAFFAFIYIYPAVKLWKYASHIGTLLSSGSMLDLEAALSQQRSFWKFLGIMVIVIFILYFLIIIGMVAFGGFAAMQAQGMGK